VLYVNDTLTSLLTPYSTVLPEKLTGSQLIRKFPAFYGTQRFITAFTNARHLSLFWTRTIQSMPPHLTSWRSSLKISSHLHLGHPSGLFPSGFPTKTLYTTLLSPTRATCPAHRIRDLITRTIWSEEYRSLSSLLCSFLHSPLPRPSKAQIYEMYIVCKYSFFVYFLRCLLMAYHKSRNT